MHCELSFAAGLSWDHAVPGSVGSDYTRLA